MYKPSGGKNPTWFSTISDSDFFPPFQETLEFLDRIGLGGSPQVLVNGVPMSHSDLTADTFEEAAVTAIMQATPELQRAVYNVSRAPPVVWSLCQAILPVMQLLCQAVLCYETDKVWH